MRSKTVLPPGAYIKEELEERGWSQRDLAYILGCAEQAITIILNGKRSITPEMAKALAIAFDVSPEFFTNLQQAYDLARAREPDSGIATRTLIQSHYPAREMIKRGWLADTKDSALLEAQLIEFFGVDSLDKVPHLQHAARKSYYNQIPPAQLAWLFRVKNLAKSLNTSKYDERKLRDSLEELKKLLPSEDGVRQVSSVLAKSGIRFIIVEGIASSKIDGVCFWLNPDSPVIGMSLRFDRIDNFWFVLRHEIEHVLHGDGQKEEIIDTDIQDSSNIEHAKELHKRELIANREASEFLIPSAHLNRFISEAKPYYSEKKILEFAKEMNVHPGIVIGQLHNRGEINYSILRKYLIKVRTAMFESAFVDGWGRLPQFTYDL
jgi:HTH-type transcriptional regulator/antitoxin HigA